MTVGRLALIGSGKRARFFHRLATQAPEHFQVTGVLTRSAERADEVTRSWGTPGVTDLESLAATEPEFVVACVPWGETADAVIGCVRAGLPVIAETPPAADREGLLRLWDEVGGSDLVQVGEQYLMMPAHDVRQQLAAEGTIGAVTSVQLSSTHLYHAVALIRGMMGIGFDPCTVTAHDFAAPLVDPLGPAGWSESIEVEEKKTTMALLDFGAGRHGLYDFTDNQWFNPLRHRRIVVRGSHGEISDDSVIRLLDPATPVTSRLERRRNGVDLDLEGVDLQHISADGRVRYRNPYVGSRFSEDDLAVVHLLERMVRWRRGEGEPPYPLADACQDHLISLAIMESARTGQPVTTEQAPWSGARSQHDRSEEAR